MIEPTVIKMLTFLKGLYERLPKAIKYTWDQKGPVPLRKN